MAAYRTPEGDLYHAVKTGSFDGAKQAIKDGANFHVVRVGHKPLIQIAAENGHRDICELLQNVGADVNEGRGARRHSLLHSAVASSDYGLASILLDLGADPTPRASNDATPLHFAARMGQEYLARKLLSHGAEIDATDTMGRTALTWAVEKEDLPMVKLLLKHNCNVNLADHTNRSALSIAVAKGNNEIKKALLDGGACHSRPTFERQLSHVAEPTETQGRSY